MIQLLPFPIMFGAGGGSSTKPRTHGPSILAVIAVLSSVLIGGGRLLLLGPAGLLVVPAFAALLAWCLLWGWLGTQCLDHVLAERGIMAGVYVGGYVICAAVALSSFIGGIMTFLIRFLGW